MRCESNPYNLVLIDTKTEESLDKGVIPAVVEYVFHEVVKRRRYSEQAPSPAILCVDRPVAAYRAFCARSSVPISNVIDGYSEWYSLPNMEKNVKHSPCSTSSTKLHVGDCSGDVVEAVAKSIVNVLETNDTRNDKSSTSKECIVIIDALTSLFPTGRIVDDILTFVDLLCTRSGATSGGAQSMVTVIGVVGGGNVERNGNSNMYALSNKMAETTVEVCQRFGDEQGSGGLAGRHVRDFVHLEVRRRKASGRVHFETTKGVMMWDESELGKTETKLNAAGNEKRKYEDEMDLSTKLEQHGLSFRTGLSSKEREARAAAGLPYVHRDEAVANSGLELHPAKLQLDGRDDYKEEFSSDSEEENIFSEDV